MELTIMSSKLAAAGVVGFVVIIGIYAKIDSRRELKEQDARLAILHGTYQAPVGCISPRPVVGGTIPRQCAPTRYIAGGGDGLPPLKWRGSTWVRVGDDAVQLDGFRNPQLDVMRIIPGFFKRR
ncbi:MAG: hypothetical protein ACYDD1_10930 [Caulobacteraceae bacterium]